MTTNYKKKIYIIWLYNHINIQKMTRNEKKLHINSENYKKWVILDLPQKLYEKAFVWKRTPEDFNEFWPPNTKGILSESISNLFEVTEIWEKKVWKDNTTKTILIQPRNTTSQTAYRSYIIWVFKEIWINKSTKSRFDVKKRDGNDFSIEFEATVRDWFDININGNQ